MAEKCQKIEPQRHGKNEEKEKRRSRSGLRPNAALKEKERLKAFNEALRNLQQVIPIKLPEGRKLHKKQTLQFACRYIHFLQGCLDGSRDWNERGRFWCESDEDHSMIDAIDAAAVAAAMTSKKDLKFGKQSRKALQLSTKGVTSKPLFLVKNKSTSEGDDYDHWLNHQPKLEFNSHPNFFSVKLPLFAIQAPVSPYPNQNEFHNRQVHVESQIKIFPPEEDLDDSLWDIKTGEKTIDEKEKGGYVTSYNVPVTRTKIEHDELDEEWKDLSEILF